MSHTIQLCAMLEQADSLSQPHAHASDSLRTAGGLGGPTTPADVGASLGSAQFVTPPTQTAPSPEPRRADGGSTPIANAEAAAMLLRQVREGAGQLAATAPTLGGAEAAAYAQVD